MDSTIQLADIDCAAQNNFTNIPDCSFTVYKLSDQITLAFAPLCAQLTSAYSQILAELPLYYLRHVNSFYDKNYRLLSAISYLMLQQLAQNPVMIQFTDSGKPYDQDNNVFFSFSHTANMTACAISSAPIGMDIAPITTYNSDMANLICCQSEQESLVKSADQSNAFTKIITQKESYLKLVGKKLNQISCSPPQSVKNITINLTPSIICSCSFFKFL